MKILRNVVLLMGLMVGSAHAQITVFPECNFQGKPVSLSVGDYNRADLNRMGIYDDDISSIVVAEGFEVTLFDVRGFRGEAIELEGVNACLDDVGFDNRTSSVSVRDAGSSFASTTTLGRNDAGVELFTECNYQGRTVKVPVGEFTAGDLRRLGIPDNSISSIRLPEGFLVELFVNDFQRGKSGKLNKNNKCLVERFNDTVSSIIVTSEAVPVEPVATGAPMAIVYSECNYRGQAAELRVGDFSANALAALGMPDNAISSLRLAEGVEMQVFQNDFFRGVSAALTSNIKCLSGDRFDDAISSIKIINKASSPAGAATDAVDGVDIFADCRYRGRQAILPVGEYTSADLGLYGFPDNTISAVKVPEGFRAVGFEHDFFRGGTVDIQIDTPCLSTRRADNAISSIKIEAVKLDKPANATLNARERRELQSGLDCVGRYVDRKMCSVDAWDVITDFCALNNVPLMSDGYLEGHVKRGNCTTRNWEELTKRISDPALR